MVERETISVLRFILGCELGSNVRSSHRCRKLPGLVTRCAEPPDFQTLIEDSYERRDSCRYTGPAHHIALRWRPGLWSLVVTAMR